jgi:hypothetical protein
LSMYKKSLLALAVATASGAALAGSLGTGTTAAVTPNYTAEGLAAADEVITGTTAILLTTNLTSLAANSLLRLTYNNGLVNDGGTEYASFPSTLEIDGRTFLTGTFANTAFMTNGTLSLVSQDGSAGTAVYQLLTANLPNFVFDGSAEGLATATDVDYSTLAVGLTSAIQLPSPFMSTTGLTTGSLTAALETIGGTAVESATGTILTSSGSQMATGTITGNAVIDVNQARQQFLAGGVNSDTTTLTLTFDPDAIAAGATKIAGSVAATTGTAAITITGQDFSWLDSDATTTGIQAANVTGLTGVTITPTTITGAATYTSVGGVPASITVTLDNDEDATIPVQSGITASADVFYTRETGGNGSTSLALGGAAVWTLNGSSIDIYAVPQSASVSNFMWLTNTGTGSVGVDATIFDGAQTCEMTSIGTSVAGTEFDLTAAIDAAKAVQCPTYVPSGNRVRINVSANAPAASLRVSAAYRVGTDRVNLLTSSEAGL